jgi:hypothetical protein
MGKRSVDNVGGDGEDDEEEGSKIDHRSGEEGKEEEDNCDNVSVTGAEVGVGE